MPLHYPKENKRKIKENKLNIKSEKLDKRKEKLLVSKAFYNRMGLLRRDPYAMDIDKRRNYYACGGFRHIAQHCRNRRGRIRIRDGRRLEYG